MLIINDLVSASIRFTIKPKTQSIIIIFCKNQELTTSYIYYIIKAMEMSNSEKTAAIQNSLETNTGETLGLINPKL